MLLRSFTCMQVLTGDMLDVLFKDFKKYRGEFDYSIELIDAALEGRVDIHKHFNLFGWCKTVKEGNFQTELRRLKNQKYLIDDDEEDKTGTKTSALIDTRSDYEIIEDYEELEYTIKKIRALNSEMISNIGIDLIFCMRQAIKGIPTAAQELSNVCEEYDWIAEYVQIILSSGISFEELFPSEVVPFCKPVKKENYNAKVG